MARSEHQNKKILVLRQLLLERTDEDHPLSMEAILSALAGYGIRAERKSIYENMESLRQMGLDIQYRKGRQGGWFVGQRSFELAELKLLVDAVQSCKFITRRKSDALIRKLEGLASVHQAGQLQRQVYVAGRVKTMNERVYYTIDRLHAALAQGHAVSFRYFEYSVDKQKVFRREGRRYLVSPYGLIWDSENYYLAGYDHEKGDLRHYRVDKMDGLRPAGPAQRDTSRPAFDAASYARKHFGMFSGQEGQVRLRCDRHLVGVILDRFGQESILVPDGPEHFTVTVEAVVSPQFLGWLFGLGDGIEVLSPLWARQAFARRLGEVAEHYRDQALSEP